MLRNYITIAWRNLWKHRMYTVINVLGLAVGIAVAFLAFLYMQHAFSYDAFHQNADRIYRVTLTRDGEAEGSVPSPTGPALMRDYPEVAEAVRYLKPFSWSAPPELAYGEQRFMEETVLYPDPAFLEIFDFPWIVGDPTTALAEPNSVVLTESMARKYFGEAEALGKTIRYIATEGRHELIVTGVMQDVPANSHLQFDYLTPFDFYVNLIRTYYGPDVSTDRYYGFSTTYALLRENADAAALASRLTDLARQYYHEDIRDKTTLHLQPLTDIHLKRLPGEEGQTDPNALYLSTLSIVGLLVLLIACINFMNLATARSAERIREIGLRKVMGAHRSHLIAQFLGEAVLLSIIALGSALFLAELLLPLFNEIANTALAIRYTENLTALFALAGIGLFTGVFSGVYPAFYLSAYRPAIALQRSRGYRSGHAGVRKTLVVGQFGVAIAMLICVMTISDQLNFLKQKDLGYQKEQFLFIQAKDDLFNDYQKLEPFKQALTRHTGIAGTAASWRILGSEPPLSNSHYIIEGYSEEKITGIAIANVDYDFVDLFGLPLLAGRNFSRAFASDVSDAFLINESAAKRFGWTPEEALGKRIERYATGDRVAETGLIVGVVANYHYRSLHDGIQPLILSIIDPMEFPFVAVKFNPDDVEGVTAHITSVWDRHVPDRALEVFYLEDEIERLYSREESLGRTVQALTGLAVIIACLGLFGLAAFSATQRTREIGVRKVLGASVSSLVLLLSGSFTKLILIAFVVSAPLAYLIMQSWLQNFAYQVDIGPGLFLLSGAVALLVALTTVSYQSIRAALANPVENLRHE